MSVTFGSGQTSGLPFLITTGVSFATRQTLHTAVAGGGTPERIRLYACNLDSLVGHTLNVEVESAGGATRRTIQETIPAQSGLFPILEELSELDLNGSCTIKVWADEASKVMVTAMVENQSSVAGVPAQILDSGLVAAVQAASRFAIGAQGGTGQATEANAQILIPRAGVLRNLRAKSDAAVGGGATVTVAVNINGVSSILSLAFANADGTAVKSDTDSVPVAVGDLVTFLVSCDNAGAPAANLQAAVEYVAS